MPLLHFHVPDEVASQIKRRAAKAGQPVSQYIAELVKRDAQQSWPDGYFERIAGVSRDDVVGHEPSGPPEERLPLR